MLMDDDVYLAHYGVLRKSGRYPWGSGEDQATRNKSFLDYVDQMRAEGMTETEIARGVGITTTQLRASKTIAKNEQKQAMINQALRLKERGYSNVAIGERMGINESSVRSLLAPGQQEKADVLRETAQMLRNQVAEKGVIDVGTGVETHLGISSEKLATAVAILREEGYEYHKIQVDQLGTNNKTTLKVLAPAGTTYRDIVTDKSKVQQIAVKSDDGGLTYAGMMPPLNVASRRLAIKYAEDGGSDADGVIYVRPGVDDVSLGGARYAQVRIAVDGTHYIKGMAMYKTDLPDGVDLMFNTNKSDTGNKLDALKKMKDDVDSPFGAVVDQITTTGPDGKRKVTSSMNIVNEEGDWEKWSRNLSSQMLSKQSPRLAKTQLDMTAERKRQELEDILELTNPAVKKKLLESFADGADSSSVHLKAAALPRQATHVILPISSMKENEVYAPNYRNGETVALVRYPHGGKFEIPELVVNNNHPPAKKALGQARDAIGIHPKVAERLSGADFDGDTVLVIPNNNRQVQTSPALERLKGFDPKRSYPAYEGMQPMTPIVKQHQMGLVSNLITDMTIKGASNDEISRAVRHSMVVIDAEKHNLDYKQSSMDNGIPQLMKKYQGRAQGGSSTLISRATSPERVLERKPRSAAKGGPIDRETGKRVYEETGAEYVNKDGKVIKKMTKSVKLAEAEDATTLSSGTVIEKVYADHSNKLKAMADTARKESLAIKTIPYSPSAKAAYAEHVRSLDAKLNLALRNRPLERQAQILAGAQVHAKRQANPSMESAEVKKLESQALIAARERTGAKKQQIELTQPEWDAIQAGAISNHQLTQILDNANLDQVKKLATPKTSLLMTSTKTARAQAMLASGYTQAEVADALGVSLTTLKAGVA